MTERIINIPDGVVVVVDGREILVRGPRGELKKDFDDPRYNKAISLIKDNDKIKIASESEKRKIKAVIGTISKHIINMVLGVTKGFSYTMKIHYSHFPISVSVKDDKVQIKNIIGEKNARVANVVGNVAIQVEKDIIKISGIDIEDISQTAANIEQVCKLSKRDRRIFQDGIYIVEKSHHEG